MAPRDVSLLILIWVLEPPTLVFGTPLEHQSLCDINACECEFERNQTTVTCKVRYAGFDFANFRNVSRVPSGPWTLKFQAALYDDFGTPSANGSWYPLAIPSNVFPSIDKTLLPKISLIIEGINLISVANGAFSGLALNSVEFSDARMTGLPLDSFLDQSKSLKHIHVYKVLQLNGTSIRPPMFDSFHALEEIKIDNMPSFRLRNRTFYNLPSLNYVRLSHTPITAISPNAFDGVPNLATLEFIHCELQRIPTAVLSKLKNLTTSDLGWNNIESVNPADVEVIRQAPSLFQLIVLNNPFICTCELLDFVHLLNDPYVFLDFMGIYGSLYDAGFDVFGISLQRPGYHCASPVQTLGKSLLDFSLVEYLETSCTLRSTAQPANVSPPGQDFVDSTTVTKLAVAIICGLVVLGIVVVALAVILHRKIKVKWVGLFRRYERQYDVMNEVHPEEYTYDAYICQHEDTEIFVAEKMIPRLEGEANNFRLCLAFRDFLIGEDKLDNVANAMATSRLVIALLDAKFIASGQCMLELNMACSRMLEAGVGAYPASAEAIPPNAPDKLGTTTLLLVLFDALPVDALPGTVSALRDKITCLEWKENEEERCWQQLSASIQAVRRRANQHQMDIAENN